MTDVADTIALGRPWAGRFSERRSILFCAIGAVAGVLIAGAGLFTARGTRIAGVPPEDVAIVNQVPVLMSDYVAQLNALYGVGLAKATAAQKHKVLDDMIREELYVQRGIELGVQTDVIEVRTAVVGAVEAQQAVDVSASQPMESELQAFYRQRLDSYSDEGRMTFTDYIAPGIAQAQAAVVLIRGGQPAERAATASGLRPSGAGSDGEEFYFAAKIHLGPRLFQAAQALGDGQVSDPIVLPDGVHIVIMRRNVRRQVRPYAFSRDQVLADYRADQVARMQSGADRFLRKRADIQVAHGFE